jgi:hypothetical protein
VGRESGKFMLELCLSPAYKNQNASTHQATRVTIVTLAEEVESTLDRVAEGAGDVWRSVTTRWKRGWRSVDDRRGECEKGKDGGENRSHVCVRR